jgi:hypothetical protein
MVRKLVLAWLAVLVLEVPAVAQQTPPEPIAIDISESLTDPLATEVCDTEVVVDIAEDLEVTVCPADPAPSSPSQTVIAPTPPPRLLSPFPIVRLVGRPTEVGTRVRLLSVRAPEGAQALVRCRGRGCPVKRAEKLVGRAPVRFAAFERLIPARVVLEVLVHRGDSVGKYTRFKFRRNRRIPRRVDGCLWPGTTRMAPCPEA